MTSSVIFTATVFFSLIWSEGYLKYTETAQFLVDDTISIYF